MRLAIETYAGSMWMAGTVTIRDVLAALHQLGEARPIIELVEWWNTDKAEYGAYQPYVDGSFRLVFPGPKRSMPTAPKVHAVEPPESLPTRIKRVVTLSPRLPSLPPAPARPDETMRRLGVDCVFSVAFEHRTDVSTALMVWIYDLQHHHFPGLLDQAELERRNRVIELEAERATLLVVKSESVREDLGTFLPQHKKKIRVMHYVSDIPSQVYGSAPTAVLAKYNLPPRFIYLPNQFWQHKNHLGVIQALAKLRSTGVFPTIVCTGSMTDHRHPDYIARVLREIQRADLQEQFLTLGAVPRDDVFALMRQSLCVLNPSFFEGFGLSTAEAISLGKQVLLSDLPSLREQNPPNAVYFDPNNIEELAARIAELWATAAPGPDLEREDAARAALPERQRKFAGEFMEIAGEAVRAYRARSA